MSPNDMQMLIKSLHLLEQEPEVQENSPVVEDTAQSDNRDYLPAIEEFLFNLGPDDVGVEKFGPYTVHFEGFSDYCQQDANDRCYLPKEDPRHLDKYEDIYDEVLRDFINREDGKMPIDSGLTGDEEYPIYYAIFKEEGIVEAKESIKDQVEKAYIQDGGNIDDYFVRHSRVDKLGFSPKQIFARSPDLDHPAYDIDYIGNSVGTPALWFYPLKYYLQSKELFAEKLPYIWLVKLRPNAWLQPVDRFTKTKKEAPQGKERVGILKNTQMI